MGDTQWLDELRRRHSWPAKRPAVPGNLQGWFHGDNRRVLASLLSDRTEIILELGSWLGLSAAWFCERAPGATVICVDHWRGSAEHQQEMFADILPVLYETFLVNLWPHRDRVVPMRRPTAYGMSEIASLGITPDLVYIDASHARESVAEDVTAALRYFPRAPIVGDDWTWESVRSGVMDAMAATKTTRTLTPHGACYVIQ
jgi:hypothetical protein